MIETAEPTNPPEIKTSSRKKALVIVVAEKLGGAGLAMLKNAPDVELRDLAGGSREKLLEAVAEADALLVRSATEVDRELIERGKGLRVIGRAGVGVDNVDVPAATERGILVVNSPSGNTLAAIEHTFALLLSLLRKIPDATASLRKGEWKRAQFVGTELSGKTLGVVGLGRIGSGVAERAQAFGCSIVGFDPYLPAARAQELGFRMLPLDELLEVADFVTLHVPVEAGAPPLIGETRLAKMKSTAVLVNCARGGLVDEAALARALESKKLAGAALDVFAEEPPPADHPLLKLANVLATPHLGASTAEAQERVAVQTVETVLAALSGSLSVPAVNLPFGPGGPELGPLLDLSRALGSLGAGILDGPVSEVSIDVEGLPERSLKAAVAAALAGALTPALGDEVNVVSAPSLAEGRGVRVFESHHPVCRDYGNKVTVKVSSDGRSACVEGTLFSDRHGRVVAVDRFRVEFEPRGWVLYIVNRNVPGVVGKVGTLLGESGVNIADMALARHPSGDRALALITTDAAPAPSVLERLARIDEVEAVKLVRL